MKQKRVLALLLAGCLLVSASGCRKGNESGGNESDEYYWSTVQYTEDWEEDGDGDGTASGSSGSSGSSSTGGSGNSSKNSPTTSNTGVEQTLVGDDARQEKIDLFGESYVKEREAYEAKHAPYQVPDSLKGTTVKFATWIDHTTTEAKYPMANFEKATGIKVEWMQVPQSGYYEKLVGMVASGTGPDVILENNSSMPMIFEICQPLNKISSIDMNDPIWDQGYFNYSKINGNVYHCNVRNSVWQTGYILFYNKKVLSENGITTPADYIKAGTWNWSNLVKMVSDFKSLNSSYQGLAMDTVQYANASGTGFLMMQNGKFTTGIQTKEFTAACQALYDLKDKNLYGGSQAGVMKGTCAGYVVDSYGLKTTGYFKGVKSNVLGFAPVPNPTGGEQYYPSHYRAYAVCKGAKNAEGAGYFLRYFLDPYNYNWDDIFLSKDAQKAYLNYCSDAPFDKKVFDYATCRIAFIGNDKENGWESTHYWDTTINRGVAAQLSTYINQISGEINTSINKANEILAKVS